MSFSDAITEQELGLFIDFYELTMAQAYLSEGLTDRAAFSLYFRELPPERNFILACGQHYAAQLVSLVCFPPAQIEYLRSLELFERDFLDWLAEYHFSGDIRVLPEGTPVFPHEPLLELEAPVAEGQLLESLLMNYIGTETVLASKAVRLVIAADGRPVVDFGMRRMQGMDAALRGVRAYRTAGIAATSNVLGSQRYDLPAQGTMAHSFVQAHWDETAAFRAYTQLYPGTTLLVDTYDTLAAIDKVIALVNDEGRDVGAVRLDSGDLSALAKAVRKKLDAAGLQHIRIIASSGLDEIKIQRLLRDGAPIDGFGVGTHMGVSADVPALDFAYKLTEYTGQPRLKCSPGKKLLPGRKQVWRHTDQNGRYQGDTIGLANESIDGEPLLIPVMHEGHRVSPSPDLEESRLRVMRALQNLPEPLLSLEQAPSPYPVEISPHLEALYQQAMKSFGA